MASGASIAGHGRQEQVVPPALVSAAGARRSKIEEAARPLDANPMVATARIVC